MVENMNKYTGDFLRDNIGNVFNIQGRLKYLAPAYYFYHGLAEPYIKNYFYLSSDYKSINDGTTTVMNIIIHIVKRVILVNFYYAIVSNLLENTNVSFKNDLPKLDSNETDDIPARKSLS